MAWRKFSSILLILGAGLFLGWFSARVMLDRAAGDSGASNTGWREVKLSDDGLWSTYRNGHYLWRGKLPPPRHARLYRRETDDTGNALRGDCSTLIEGKVPEARWWMLSADNGAAASALSSGNMIREPDNTFSVTAGSNVSAGNWLRIEGSRSYVIFLTIEEAKGDGPPALPRVKRLWC